MALFPPIAGSLDTRAAEPTRVSPQGAEGPVAQAAAKIRAEQEVERKHELLPANLMVRLDVQAERFVQTFTDATTNETVLKYPSDGQLAFSRAVMAYLRARITS